MIQIRDATTNDIERIRQIAEQTWWATYITIISEEQIRYMLGAMYSPEAIGECIITGTQRFILLDDEHGSQGFAAYGIKPGEQAVKLHKLYVLPGNHGKGYGKRLIEEVISRTKALGLNILDLNVNRYNPAFSFYRKIGFRVLREEDIPFGPYWANDYVMRMEF